MKILKTRLLLAAIVLLSISIQACKTKKIVAKPTPVVEKAPEVVETKKPEPVPVETAPVVVEEKVDFNFTNVQFEFNSDVLKTASFEILDRVAREMKKDASAKLTLNGHSSAEGSVAHNMSLSVDRANSVKSYLINAGVNASNLTVKGFGATKPATANTTEAGKALNRRVEFQVNAK